MKIGFTGNQKGLSPYQKKKIKEHFDYFQGDIEEVHHGGCIGADSEFEFLVWEFNPFVKIVLHPPIDKSKQAPSDCDEERKPKGYIKRNHDIVDETDILIAAPSQNKEILRSGTWATIRYAKKKNKAFAIFYPKEEKPTAQERFASFMERSRKTKAYQKEMAILEKEDKELNMRRIFLTVCRRVKQWRQRRAFKKLSPAWQQLISALGCAPKNKKD